MPLAADLFLKLDEQVTTSPVLHSVYLTGGDVTSLAQRPLDRCSLHVLHAYINSCMIPWMLRF